MKIFVFLGGYRKSIYIVNSNKRKKTN